MRMVEGTLSEQERKNQTHTEVVEIGNLGRVLGIYADHILGMDCRVAGDTIEALCKDTDLGCIVKFDKQGYYTFGIFHEGEPVLWADNRGKTGNLLPCVARAGHAARFIPGVGFARESLKKKTLSGRLLPWAGGLQVVSFAALAASLPLQIFFAETTHEFIATVISTSGISLALSTALRIFTLRRPRYTTTEVLQTRELVLKMEPDCPSV